MIVKSILDTDLYKFTTSYPILLTDKVYWFEKRRFVPSDLYILFETGYMFETPKLIGEKDE